MSWVLLNAGPARWWFFGAIKIGSLDGDALAQSPQR